MFLPAGAKSLLSEDHLAQQDLALLAVLDFLCECGSVQPVYGLLFKPQEVRRRLLLLLQQVDFSRALHLHMVGVVGVAAPVAPERLANPPLCLPLFQYLLLLKKLPAEGSLAPEEFDSLLDPLAYGDFAPVSIFLWLFPSEWWLKRLCAALPPQRPVFGLPSGPGRLCCCSAGFVTLHQESGGIPPPARGNETRSGIAAPSRVCILVSPARVPRVPGCREHVGGIDAYATYWGLDRNITVYQH